MRRRTGRGEKGTGSEDEECKAEVEYGEAGDGRVAGRGGKRKTEIGGKNDFLPYI